MIPLPVRLPLRTRNAFALFFEEASLSHNNIPLNTKNLHTKYYSSLLKNQIVEGRVSFFSDG